MMMNINYIIAGASLAFGAAVGSVTTWILTKKHCNKLHQKEMDKVWSDIQKGAYDKPKKRNQPKKLRYQ